MWLVSHMKNQYVILRFLACKVILGINALLASEPGRGEIGLINDILAHLPIGSHGQN